MMKKTTLLLFMFISATLIGQDKLTSKLTEHFDGTNYLPSSKTTFTYDSNGNLIKEIEFNFDWHNSSWVETSNSTYTYNLNNKVTEELRVHYDYNTKVVNTTYKTFNSYNGSGDLIQTIDEEYNKTGLVKKRKTDITYAANKLSFALHYGWDGTQWIYESDRAKTEVFFNANDKIDNMIAYKWTGTEFVKAEQEVLSYDVDNNFILNLSQSWNGTSWDNGYKEERTHDANKNTLTVVESEYNSGTGSYTVDRSETNTFDTAILLSTFAHPFKDKNGIENLINNNDKYVNKILTTMDESDNRTTYNYNEPTASIANYNLANFAVYPNPTNSNLKIDDSKFSLKSVELYNVLGKKVLSTTQNQLNVEHLVNGIYMLKIETVDGGFSTKKIIKN